MLCERMVEKSVVWTEQMDFSFIPSGSILPLPHRGRSSRLPGRGYIGKEVRLSICLPLGSYVALCGLVTLWPPTPVMFQAWGTISNVTARSSACSHGVEPTYCHPIPNQAGPPKRLSTVG